MSEPFQLDAIIDAIIFAARKHQGHVRKDQQASPYVTHPLAVARTIYAIGKVDQLPVLIAAILHDTIEDTDTTEEELRDHFGAYILALVLEVTDDKTQKKNVRKQLQVIHAPCLSQEAKIIKLADKLCNCHDILHTPPKDWSIDRRREYVQWSADVVAGIRGTNQPLEEAFDNMLGSAEEVLSFTVCSIESINDRPWGPNAKI